MKPKPVEYYAIRYGLVDIEKKLKELVWHARKVDNETRHKLKQIKTIVHETNNRGSRRN